MEVDMTIWKVPWVWHSVTPLPLKGPGPAHDTKNNTYWNIKNWLLAIFSSILFGLFVQQKCQSVLAAKNKQTNKKLYVEIPSAPVQESLPSVLKWLASLFNPAPVQTARVVV